MKVVRKTSEDLENLRDLQQQHLELVLALTRANGDLLRTRQRASGMEFDVMTAERNHANGTQNAVSDAVLDKMYAQNEAAKLKLTAAEDHIEELERHLTDITWKMARPEM